MLQNTQLVYIVKLREKLRIIQQLKLSRVRVDPHTCGRDRGRGDLVDTTGAGDLFAGGFLHAYTQGESLQSCGELGALCAGQIVTQLGARSQVDLKELAKTHRS